MIIPRANRKIPIRTLETLTTMHDAFMKDGGNLKRAKIFDNVIGTTFFNIPLTQNKAHLIH